MMDDHFLLRIALLLLSAVSALAVSGSSGSTGGSRKLQDVEEHGPGRPGRLLRQEGKLAGSDAASVGHSAVASLAEETPSRGGKQRLTLGANGALVKEHDAEEPSVSTWSDGSVGGGGSIVWRFIARDGRQIAKAGGFHGPTELEKRLVEIEQRCPLLLNKGWSLIDSAADTENGHHWIFRGPVHGKRSLLHVSSVIKAKDKKHSLLRFSPRKSCGPSVLLQFDPAADNPSNVSFDELEMAQLDNPNVVDSWLWAADKLKAETSEKCKESQKIDNITLVSARLEVAAGMNVFLTVSVIPIKNFVAPTYHEIRCDWHVEDSDGGHMHPNLILPYRKTDHSQLGWCELLTESTEAALLQVATKDGHEAAVNIRRRFGWLGLYRDYHPNPDLLEEEDLAEAKAKAEEHLRLTCPIFDINDLDTDWSPETSMPSCFSVDTVENQGECGACWAFSVATSLAMRMCVAFPAKMGIGSASGRKKLSKQQMLSCNEDRAGCDGGSMTPGFNEAKKGISIEEDYPYDTSLESWPWSRTGRKCQWGNVAKPFIVTSTARLSGENDMRKELYCNGPMVVGFEVKTNWLTFYEGVKKSDVYTMIDALGDSSKGGHAVTLFAWGMKDGTKYWKLQNSWGPQWGDSGNFKFQRGVNLCRIEDFLVLGGTVAETTGTWQYSDWTSCEGGEEQKSRGIRCMGNDLVSQQDESTCPSGAEYGNWPDVSSFPNPSATNEQEVNAFRSCTETADQCTRPFACNGNGDASKRNIQMECRCDCDPWFVGDDCGQCSALASGYPRCREMCTSKESCNEKGVASGNKWHNEFGDPVDNCECDCNSGFMGDSCEQCVKPEDTWPLCQAHKELVHGMAGGTWTTTTTWPPCQVWQGPIELEPPPVGSNPKVVLRCDVRSANCAPSQEMCVTGSYPHFCIWNGTMCIPKSSGDSSLVQNLRLYLTRHDYALPVEPKRNQSSNLIMWQNNTIGLTPSELGMKSLQHRLMGSGDV